jgi:ABC-2 type transport system permease protein
MTEATLSHVQSNPSLWRYVWKLLRLRWVITISNFRRANRRRKFGMIILVLLAVSGLVFAFVLSWLLLRFMRSPQLAQFIGDTTPLLESMPTLVISGAFVAILLTSFAVLLQALYLAGDMDFLLSAPVPIRAIFITKLLQATLPNFSLILLFGLPVLYGLGVSGGYNPLYYPMVLIVLALVALATAGLSSLLVMAVVRIFPARRVAEVLGFIVAILSFTCSQSGQFARYANVSAGQASQMLSLVTRFNMPWSPLTWAGRGLVDLGEGRWLSGGGLVLLTIILTSGVFAVSLAAAERLYYSGWASVQISVGKKQAGRPARRAAQPRVPIVAPIQLLLPADVRGIIGKDWLMLRRDLRNMTQIITPLILGVIYGLALIRGGGQPSPGSGNAPPIFMEIMNNVKVYGNVAISLFVSWSLLSRLMALAFSMEGKNYWMVKMAPISTARLLAAKYMAGFFPTLILGWVFLVIISLVQRASAETLIFSLLVVLLTIAGTGGLSLSFGVVGANFKWEDPRRISQGGIGCIGALATFAFLGTSLLLFFGPAVLVKMVGGPAFLGELAGLAMGGVFCLAGGFITLRLVSGRVARLGED